MFSTFSASSYLDFVHQLKHPSSSILLPYVVQIPQPLLDSWARLSIDVAMSLMHQPYWQPSSCVPAEHSFPDFMSIDWAITGSGDDPKLQLIEAQAYPSVFHYCLEAERHCGQATVLQNRPLEERATIFRRLFLGDVAEKTSILLVQSHQGQTTGFDMELAGRDVPVISLDQLRYTNKRWYYPADGRFLPVERVYNRVIFINLDARQRQCMQSLLADSSIQWLNHPSWFERISKASLQQFPHPNNPPTRPCTLPGPADLTQWVLKTVDSFSGRGIILHPSVQDLKLASAGSFLQRRVQYTPCIQPPSPAAQLHCAEIRFLLLCTGQAFLPITNLLRVSKQGMISQSMKAPTEHEGASIAIGV